MSAFLREALKLAARGWPVFPLIPRRKEPMTPHGFKDATTDTNTIEAWWRRAPLANIGIATGAASGLLVVDVDPRNGGDESLMTLELAHGLLPTTIRAVTGGGGQHFFFRMPLTPMPAKLAEGIDLKSDGGYVVAPPSVHPDTAREYVWDAGAHPDETDLADVPSWLLAVTASEVRSCRNWEPAGPATDSFIATAFIHAGWVGRSTKERLYVRCPWAEEHSDARGYGGDSSTVILPPLANHLGAFFCSHTHCTERDTAAAIAVLPRESVALAAQRYPAGFRAAMWRTARSFRNGVAR